MEKEERELIEEKRLDEVEYRFTDTLFTIEGWVVAALAFGIIAGVVAAVVLLR